MCRSTVDPLRSTLKAIPHPDARGVRVVGRVVEGAPHMNFPKHIWDTAYRDTVTVSILFRAGLTCNVGRDN